MILTPDPAARRVLTALVMAAAPLACAGCSTTATATTTASNPAAASPATTVDAVTITGAVVVEPVAAGDPANIIFTAVNGTGTADAVTSVTSPISSEIVLNNTLSSGATTDPIALAAHSTTQLGEVGPDLWVFDPTLPHPGSTVTLTVHLRHAAQVTTHAAVRSAAQMAQTAAATSNTP